MPLSASTQVTRFRTAMRLAYSRLTRDPDNRPSERSLRALDTAMRDLDNATVQALLNAWSDLAC